jgi:metal transporter CNNM
MFSGLTLGFFGLTRLRLEVMAEIGDKQAIRILKLREDANFLLSTLLWGNVGINVLLTLLTDSVLTGVGAFVFSTVGITCFGEIMPQAYFSRHALKAGSLLVPVVRFYQVVLYPVAKPTSLALDRWLGKEGVHYFREKEIQIMLKRHSESEASDVDRVESTGAANFLSLDDILIRNEGEIIDRTSIIRLPEENGIVVFPSFAEKARDAFLQRVHESKKKWVVITNENDQPKLVMDSDEFLRDAVYERGNTNPYFHCHRPIVITDPEANLGTALRRLKVNPEHAEDDVIDDDIVIYWTQDERRIITGADILGRLLRGIASIRK